MVTTVNSNPAAAVTTTTSSKPAVPKAEVRVYTAGGEEAAATRVGDRLREAGWNVTEAGAPIGTEVPATTVYFGSAEGEQAVELGTLPAGFSVVGSNVHNFSNGAGTRTRT